MKCFCWNIRGLNGNTRKSDVQNWIRTNRPMFGAFLETHVKQDVLASLITSTLPGWKFDSNHSPHAENGRIVVVWNPSLFVVVYFRSPQIMVCGVFDPATQQHISVCFAYLSMNEVTGCLYGHQSNRFLNQLLSRILLCLWSVTRDVSWAVHVQRACPNGQNSLLDIFFKPKLSKLNCPNQIGPWPSAGPK